ncbi:MAG: DUF2283 domain-containing protein [Victivallales bacterium]|nr:DUF2283 domain-containing protein [Victivallales bacterium]
MKRTLLTLLFAGFVANALFAEDVVTQFTFDTEPRLKTVALENKDDARHPFLATTFKLKAPTNGQSFAFSADVNLTTWHHYGWLVFGLADGTRQKAQFAFTMGDNRVRVCRPLVQVVPGVPVAIKEFAPVSTVPTFKAKAFIVYDAAKRVIKFSLLDAEGKPLFTTEEISVKGKFNLKEIQIAVANSEDEVSEISYDPDTKALFVRSYVGVEGEYAYMIEGTLDNIIVDVDAPEEEEEEE